MVSYKIVEKRRIDPKIGRVILDMYHFVRSQSQFTKLFGPQYTRSRELIEIDITYRCNLKCINCNRSCTLAPSTEEMTIGQIEQFVNESIENNIKWKQIRILGGEPTLHTNFFTIMELLLAYKRAYNPDLHIIVVTNGFGDYVKKVLEKLPKEVEIENTSKDSKNPSFSPFNIAPEDCFLYKNVDYSNGCWIMSECGMGLTPLGYYPCAVAGSIDRVFNLGIYRKKFPLSSDPMIDQLLRCCRFCGHFRLSLPTRKEKISRSWKRAYDAYKQR